MRAVGLVSVAESCVVSCFVVSAFERVSFESSVGCLASCGGNSSNQWSLMCSVGRGKTYKT